MSAENHCFLTLHIGAGYHSHLKEHEYQHVCRQACNVGMKLLRNGKSCVDVVEKVCCFLEDSPLTNAGYGSNLSIDGVVECDAGIMESSNSSFGAVTCLKEVKNPIKLAKILLDEQLLPCKLIPPIVLAGEGAREKAVSCGLELLTNDELTSPQAFNDHYKYKRILEDEGESVCKKIKLDSCDENEGDQPIYSENINNISFTDESFCSTEDLTPTKDKDNSGWISETCDISITEGDHCYNKTVNREVEDNYSENKNDEHCYCKNINEDETISDIDLSTSRDSDHSYNRNVNDRISCTESKECDIDKSYFGKIVCNGEEKICEAKNIADLNEKGHSPVPVKFQRNIEMNKFKESKLEDTIGVICVDNELNIASGVSSGGIVLKHSGRVSHASHYGCGCWAFRYSEDFSVGCCTSGCGELLIRTGLAKKAAEYSLRKTDKVLNYNEFMQKKFLHSPYIDRVKGQRFCGLLVAKLFKEEKNSENYFIDFHLAHTSESFCVSFMSGNMKKSQFILSRLDKDEAGKKVMSQGFTLRI